LIPIKQIEKHNHILIECDKKYFPQASVLYSYMLMCHKKVSLYSEDKSQRYSFLAWSDKVRIKAPSSADYTINAEFDILDLYTFLKKNEITINKKMATALYAGFLERYDGFLSPLCDGTIFAILSELIEYGADHILCVEQLTKKVPLSTYRLKAIVYKKLLLQNNAKRGYVSLVQEDFESSGAKWNDLWYIAKEILNLVHLKEVLIIKDDEKDKIINIKKEV